MHLALQNILMERAAVSIFPRNLFCKKTDA
jgi:hypothetical protein